jgi:hypothetical protein
MLAKLLKVLIGLVLVVLGAYLIYLWGADLLVLIRGGLGLVLILCGLIAFALVAD